MAILIITNDGFLANFKAIVVGSLLVMMVLPFTGQAFIGQAQAYEPHQWPNEITRGNEVCQMKQEKRWLKHLNVTSEDNNLHL